MIETYSYVDGECKYYISSFFLYIPAEIMKILYKH